MEDILDDKLNLQILEDICAGNFVGVNYSYLAKKLRKHRNTVRKEVMGLFSNGIINKPIFPFFGHYKEHPLMILVYADMPLTKKVINWIKTDDHVFAAYKVKEGEYNLLLFLFHRNFLRYNLWRKEIVKKRKIPPRRGRYHASASFFPTELMVKYDPAANIDLLEAKFARKGKLVLNDYSISKLGLQILRCLLKGEGIRLNEHLLAKKLGIHRKTLQRRIELMQKHNRILSPVCRFPSLFSYPDSLLMISLLEITKEEKKIINYLKKDPHVSMIFGICSGRYNYLLFETFDKIQDSIEWEHAMISKFKDCFGQNEILFLAPNMTVNVDQQKVSLSVIRKKLEMLENMPKEKIWDPFER